VRSNQKLCGADCDSTNVARVSLGEISPNKKKDATVRCQATLTSPSSALAHSDDTDDVVPENYSFDVLDENACPSSSFISTRSTPTSTAPTTKPEGFSSHGAVGVGIVPTAATIASPSSSNADDGKQKEVVERMIAAAKKKFNALAAKDQLALIQNIVVDVGFDQTRKEWVTDLFCADTPYPLDNESLNIEREKWEMNAIILLLQQSNEWKTSSEAAREGVFWELRKEMQVLRQKRDDHDRNLLDGNI